MTDAPELQEAPDERGTSEASIASPPENPRTDDQILSSVPGLIDKSRDSIAFLRAMQPEGPWCLVAIDKFQKPTAIETRTFLPGEEDDAAAAWRAKHHDVRNLYYTLNTVIGRPTSKPKKTDIARVGWLHVDIDPEIGKDADAERRRILELLTSRLPEGVPPPNVIVDSGGGYQSFWKLGAPIEIDGDEAKAKVVEGYTKRLEKLFGADNTHNVDRVMRWPGTMNVLDPGKLAKGRVKAMARVVDMDLSFSYALADFPSPVEPTPERAPSAAAIDAGRAMTLDELPERLRRIAQDGTDDPEGKPHVDGHRSERVLDFACHAVRAGANDEALFNWLLDPALKISESVLEKGGGARRYAQKQIDKAHELVAKDPLRLSKDEPVKSAREFKRRIRPTLLHYNDDWLAHDGAAYTELETETVRSELYSFLDSAVAVAKNKDTGEFVDVPFRPNRDKVGNVLDALRAKAHAQRDRYAPPCWLSGDGPPPSELLACRNGLLHLPSGVLLPATERFFTRNALEFDYHANAAHPRAWLDFLNQLWAGDAEILLLQEIFGYLLTPDTSQQKIFLLVGPRRSGKGTILRVLVRLVGHANRCAPTLDSLGKDFGLEPLIGKQLACVSDMRLGPKSDTAKIAENLLRISGEDDVDAARKYKRAWTGRLGVRFLILTNEMPSIKDASGAVASRFVPLTMTESFLGREDTALFDRLLPELPGVLNWAIDGWRRLRERGRFVLPPASRAAIEEMEHLGAPVKAWLSEVLESDFEMHPDGWVDKDVLFLRWKAWAEERDMRAGDKGNFAKRLIEASGRRIRGGDDRVLGDPDERGDRKQVRVFTGIKKRNAIPF
ncbi:MAG: hypothetical protein JNJ73_02030 [Hyphomonadaceae bacterium]|nr:hypothetical protein [Hyphomonadaceae bacterium]